MVRKYIQSGNCVTLGELPITVCNINYQHVEGSQVEFGQYKDTRGVT